MFVKTIRSDRFKAIVSAYGSDPRRWPVYERDAALDFMRRAPQKARELLRDAGEVDGLLDSVSVPEASDAFHWQTLGLMMPDRGQVLAFPGRSAASGGRSPFVWMTGAGLAAACAAGIILGTSLSLMSIVDQRVQDVLVLTSIVDLEN